MNYNDVQFITSFGTAAQLPPPAGPEVVFAGRSNVGKSSCINKLFNRKSLARVSAQPGKTVTINFFSCGPLHFVDLPGYGYAKVSRSEKLRWAELIESYFAQRRDIRLVLSLMDARHAPSEDDCAMADFLLQNGLPFVVVLTKADKLKKSELAAQLELFRHALPHGETLTLAPFSAQTGDGVAALRAMIDDIAREASAQG